MQGGAKEVKCDGSESCAPSRTIRIQPITEEKSDRP
jgi:hypothetical protein